MGRFNWWRRGIKKKKKLDKSAPLIERINNGDFDPPVYRKEAKKIKREIKEVEKQVEENLKRSRQITIFHEKRRKTETLKKRYRRLMIDDMKEEKRILKRMKKAFVKHFGKQIKETWEEDLWKCDCDIEGLYYYFKDKQK